MAVYGYCRISRAQQNIERQIRNIKAVYPEAVIIQEAFTGTKIDRPEWNKLFKRAGEGDVIIFDSVSRMSRNAEEGFAAYEDLFSRGVELVFLKEPHINTSTYKNAVSKNIAMTGVGRRWRGFNCVKMSKTARFQKIPKFVMTNRTG